MGSDLQFEVFEPRHKFDLKAVRQFAEIVEQEKIDVINVQGSSDRYISIFARWFFGMKARLVHTRQQKPVGMNWFKAIFYTKGTDAVIAVSKPVKQFLIQSRIPEDHIRVVHNAIIPKQPNPEMTESLRRQYSISLKDIVIGCVSRIKKQDQILNALRQIDRPVTVIFVGISDDYPHLKKLSNEISNKHKVIYTGEISREDTLAYYPLFTMKILASDMEGLSLSLLEAMSFGVPVIATNASGNPDLISHGENGLLFEDADVDELADCAHQIIENEDLGMKLGEKGINTVTETFSYVKMLEEHESFMNSHTVSSVAKTHLQVDNTDFHLHQRLGT